MQSGGYEQRFAKDEIIIKENAKGDRIFLIRSGTVLIARRGPEPDELIPIVELGPGEIFGEMYLMHSNQLRNAYVVAASEVVVNVFFEEEIAADLKTMSPFQRAMFGGLTSRLSDMNNHYLKLTLAAVGEGADEPAPTVVENDKIRRNLKGTVN